MAGLHDRVAGRRPTLRTVVIPGAGHLVHIDKPAEFLAAVRESSASAEGGDAKT
jgi:pimeloyl-ACP methyl ester carboxylesterase